MFLLRRAFIAFMVVLASMVAAHADEAATRAAIAKFGQTKSFSDVEKIIKEVAATGDPAAARVLNALADGNLYSRQPDGGVFIVSEKPDSFALFDPVNGTPEGSASKGAMTKVKVKNSLRRDINDAVGNLTLAAKDPAVRFAAATTMLNSPDPTTIGALDAAISRENDAAVKARMEAARASAILVSDKSEDEKAAAIDLLGARGDRDTLSLLLSYEANAKGKLRARAAAAISNIRDVLQWWGVGQNIWYGISLGSVLLLAAIGLAITFGVMGVINMAHGEMVMLGAYTTFVVQEVIRTSFPGLFDWSLAIALPLAFLVAGAVGLVIERCIIRFLYGRPLETLLATWGVSLILQQAVRTIFGPTNRAGRQPVMDVGRVRSSASLPSPGTACGSCSSRSRYSRAPLRAQAHARSACTCARLRRTGAWPRPWASARPGSTP